MTTPGDVLRASHISSSVCIFSATDTPGPSGGEADASRITVIHKTDHDGTQGLIIGASDGSEDDDGRMIRLDDAQAFELATAIIEALT